MGKYSGLQGIASLKDKIRKKSNKLVADSAFAITQMIIDESPVGSEMYYSPTLMDVVDNEVGDFKNSWSVGIGKVNYETRDADPTGADAFISAEIDLMKYNLESNVYVTNSIEYAGNVEDGWLDNPTYGWKAKEGYKVVEKNIDNAVAILYQTANRYKA